MLDTELLDMLRALHGVAQDARFHPEGTADTTFTGSVNLGGGTRTVTLGNSATFSNEISNGGLNVVSSGSPRTLNLGGTNSYSGATSVGTNVTLAITEADPVVKGQTAASSYKPAVLENGIRVLVPPFISSGERIIVDTNELTYVRRAD